MFDEQAVKMWAHDLGWDVFWEKPEHKLIRLVRDGVRIDVWLSKKRTVAVSFEKGAPKYFRFITERKMDELLDDPHTFVKNNKH